MADDFSARYRARQQALSSPREDEDEFAKRFRQRQQELLEPPRSPISEFTRGLATGGLQAATTTGEVFGVGRGSTEAVEEYFDPRGTAGRAGQVIGRIGGEIGTSLLGGGLLLKGFKAIPKAAKALEGMSAARRALAVGAIQAPVDVVQGAKEEEGIFLPGRAGSIVESVTLGQVGPALQARRASRAAREAEAARAAMPTIETRPERLLPAQASRLEGTRQYESPLGPAIPTRSGMPETRPERLLPETGVTTPVARRAYEEPIGPAIPMSSGLDVDPDEVTRRLAEAATQAGIDVPKPLIEVVESSARGSQPFRYDARNKTYRLYGTNRTQERYLRSIEATADKLDKEATRLRAFQEPDMEAVTQLEAAAEAGRRMRDVLSPSGLVMPPFAAYDLGGATGTALRYGIRQPVVSALTGAGVGAGTADSEDPADIIGRAVLGAGAGLGLSKAVTGGIPSASRLAEALRRGEVDRQTVIEGRLRKAGSVGEPKLFEPTISPAVAKLVDEQATQVERELAAAGVFRESKSLKDMTKEGERFLGSLAPGARTIMTDEEFAGRAARIGRREDALRQIDGAMQRGGLTDDDLAFLEDAHKRIFNAIVADAEVVQPALSSAGRRMNIARQMGARDIRSALNTAKSLLDLPAGVELNDAVKDQIRAVFAGPEANRGDGLQRVYQALAKRTKWEQASGYRMFSLLSNPATWLVNILGSGAEAAQNAIAHPTALALDAASSALTGKARVVRGVYYGDDFRREAQRTIGRMANRETLQKIIDGIPVENVYGNLDVAKGSFVTDWNLRNPGGTAEQAESAFRKTARLGARTLDVVSNGVKGFMEASDLPFYRGALAANLKERAVIRALKEGLGSDPQKFAQRVEELLTPDGANVMDQMLAAADALDATYKTSTGVGQALRSLEQQMPIAGAALRFVTPFANTVTNITMKALEGVPGIGFGITASKNKVIARKMKRLGATVEDISDETRRRYTQGLARQLTTGMGGIAAGFYLHQAGRITPGYVPARGATDAEREEMQRRQLTGESPLSIRVGDESLSLSALATLAPALAIGAALSQAVKDDTERGIGMLPTAVGTGLKTAYRTFLDMPLLKGMSGLADIAREGADRIPAELGKQAASFIPSVVAATARGMDATQRARPETFSEAIMERVPGLRERLAIAPGPFGERQEAVGVVRSLFDPTRARKIRTGGIYEQLEQLEMYPGQRARREGESAEQYAARRAYEGEREKQVLEDILTGRSQGLRSVSAGARRNFRRTVEEQGEEEAVRQLLAVALRQQRARMTAEDKKFAERQARQEGYRRNTEAFKARVKQIEAGQP